MKWLLGIALAAALAAGGYYFGQHRAHRDMTPAAGTDSGRKVLYWHDPMFPQHKFDKPGKSPFMDMQLVPVYADEQQAAGGVSVSPQVQQSLGLRSANAEVVELKQELTAIGYVQADERRMARAEVRVSGWIERLHVRAASEPVRAGQVLAEIYSPELVGAQEEYLLARRMAQANDADRTIAQASRKRLESLGLSPAHIEKLEQAGVVSRRVPIIAPISGIVSELGVREGAMVQAGTAAFTLTDLSSVWITVEVPEAQGALLQPGLRAQARVPTQPDRRIEGRLEFVYPEVNAQTRTVKARIAVPNPRLVLKPGMFTDIILTSSTRKALAVPSEAVIHTGTRAVVIVMDGERFRAATVKTGTEIGGRTEILEGLKEGERVVASGQFLIDSEASLKTALDRIETAKPAASVTHAGKGKVTAVDPAKGRIELDHEPIASMNWPHMKMGFAVEDKAALRALKPGDRVEFELKGEPDKDGNYAITRIRKAP
jgi:Cu(I)/Ag(I) efflux system membrane fusion protein